MWPNFVEPVTEIDAPMNTPESVIYELDEAQSQEKSEPEPKVEILLRKIPDKPDIEVKKEEPIKLSEEKISSQV